MIVDPKEILFIRKHAPYGMLKIISNNINMTYDELRKQFYMLKDEWPDELVLEARRLLKANTGLEYSAEKVDNSKG